MLSLFGPGPALSRPTIATADALTGRTPGRRTDEQVDLRSAPTAAAAEVRKGTITVEPPPELPRVVPPSLLRRALPYLIVILIVGMIVAMVATGMRLISPQTLFFPFVLLLAATALYRGSDNKMRTEEVDAERADYLRYLSVVRDNIRTQAADQKAALLWSHPDPADLARFPAPDGSGSAIRMTPTSWWCGPAGMRCRCRPRSASRTPPTRSISNRCRTARCAACSTPSARYATRPTGIDLAKVSRITVLGDPDQVRGAVRAWVAQAVDLARRRRARSGAGQPDAGVDRTGHG